jgi:hypothetical protein
MFAPNANGENRKFIAIWFGTALLAAIGTKIGEWIVAEARHKYGKAPEHPPPADKP